jgi:UDP-GlcNAc:undecaprenyl-phosphate GlcNAc-1-phosphate transferase
MQPLSVIVLASLAALVSFASTLYFTPLIRWFAHRVGAVDRPDGNRKLQKMPVALLGGVAVLGGLAVTVIGAAAVGAMPGSLNSILLVALSMGMLCAAGIADDLRNLRPHWKLAAQCAAVVPLFWTGYQIESISAFGYSVELSWLGVVATVAWVILCTNAFNLIDGMDGLCSTVALCVALGVAAIGMIAGATHTVICATAIAGSLLAFFMYNRPPASIYLGDAGSMVVGMTLALLTLRIAKVESGQTYPHVLIALMALPLGDVLLALTRRKLAGVPIWGADRGHIHHRLLDAGRTVSQGLRVITCVCLATSAIAAVSFRFNSAALAVGGLALLAIATVRWELIGHYEWALLRMHIFGIARQVNLESNYSVSLVKFSPAENDQDNQAEHLITGRPSKAPVRLHTRKVHGADPSLRLVTRFSIRAADSTTTNS